MSDPNAFISNGTCYTARGEKLDGSFIPCGNDAFGYQTCCGAGDNCLADNACFGIHGSGYGSYLTYWAGCTDPDYEAATCPKKVVDQPWVALTLCDNSDGEWAVCSQDGNPSTLQPGSYCSCTNAASATVAFSDANTITSICSLPESTGQSIQFFVGHFPSSSLTTGSAAPSQESASPSTSAGDISTDASSSATATSGPTPTKATSTEASSSSVTVFTSSGKTITSSTAVSTTTPTAGPDGASGVNTHSGLSSGAKVGIGVGIGIGVAILLAILLALFLLRRKRRRRSHSRIEGGGDGTGERISDPHPSEKPPRSPMSTAPTVYDANGQKMPEADGRAALPWVLRSELEGSPALRSELEGSPVTKKTESGPIAELPGSEDFARAQGAPNTLVQEANRQIGPGWKGPSLKVLNSSAGKVYMQASS
ncbi:uncharacterized protein Z519_05555 [Cladophialophora bantiana CBS 173.52]|uniref:Mid2 domain-containing protein n=1 Tax=Cladophialophora bantiana (strain ATCC 10958 / CBS 173.52 / CDC B-1940 / NIH 8579) TaxID=1442370 RepID=A0A0D2IBQ1_CLAB1|nr:uncharacterized protein Z519_05555 [Cladophialophora bantiana CBS 173.52]KIW94239.1 hypothetical protein Z519_05555 [Cladophialophora bantiana CBS 173.52]